MRPLGDESEGGSRRESSSVVASCAPAGRCAASTVAVGGRRGAGSDDREAAAPATRSSRRLMAQILEPRARRGLLNAGLGAELPKACFGRFFLPRQKILLERVDRIR